MSTPSQRVREIPPMAAEQFHREVAPAQKPVVIRGLVEHWPLVQTYKQGTQAFCEYLQRHDRGMPMVAVKGPAANRGRIFYNRDMTGLNCQPAKMSLAGALDDILRHASEDPAPTLAIQSIVAAEHLPGVEKDNVMPLLAPSIEPRLWIGGRATVAAHYDGSENIACCVAGKRRFTLFPPNQVANLYPGPFELTPAGAVISMVDFDNPDYDAHPRFKQAQEQALVADLEPGDVIYIPYLWWHHVRALDDLNVLVNYWWGEPSPKYGDPRNALFYAMMTMRTMPKVYRDAWREHFNYYVFDSHGQPGEHLPEPRRGIMQRFTPETVQRLKQHLVKALGRH